MTTDMPTRPIDGKAVALLRPEAQAADDRYWLSERGIYTVSAPMLEITLNPEIKEAQLATAISDATHLIMTSQNAALMLDTLEIDRTLYHEMPCYCVGPKTAEVASAVGLNTQGLMPQLSQQNAAALAHAIISDTPPQNAQFVWLSGAQVNTDLISILKDAGITAQRHILYHATKIVTLSPEMRTLISTDRLGGIIALSRRTLDTFLELLKQYGLWHHHHKMILFAASSEMINGIDMQFTDCHFIGNGQDGHPLEVVADVMRKFTD